MEPPRLRSCYLIAFLYLIVQTAASIEQQKQNCGAAGQKCCLSCPPEIKSSECDQRECSGGLTCHTFGLPGIKTKDGKTQKDMNVCLQTPQDCGKEGNPCCYVSDATSEAERCGPGLTCIVSKVGYADQAMYHALLANSDGLKSTEVMGVCTKVTKEDCGKRYYPCGASARRLGCEESAVQCADGDFCASPMDTQLGSARCLPLPPRCGLRNNGCCPPNKDSLIRERSWQDGKSPVPFCSDGLSFCLWKFRDYAQNGLQGLNEQGGKQMIWDGYFQRGYGESRCAPLPPSCGNPGEPCCPSMQDQRISGMVHNRRFRYQPCNYNAAGKVGIYCKGSWQASLLAAGEPLGICTLNTPDCGKIGKACCREDVPESGSVKICESTQRPGSHYCTADNICSKCPDVPTTKEQKEECRALGQQVESGNPFSARGPGPARVQGSRG